jgi:MFS family permease
VSPNNAVASGSWRGLIPVFAACMAMGLQAGTAMPLVPLTLEREGVDKLTIGFVTATWAIGMLAFGTRIPGLASRLGAVRVIVMAAVAGACINVAYTFTSGPLAWGLLTFLHGIVGGVPWVVSEIWMNTVVDESRRGRVMGVYGMMVAIGMAIGPLVLQVTGVYGPTPFLAAAALGLLVALPLLPYWRTAPRIRYSADSNFSAVMRVAPLAMFAAFACGLGEQVAFSFLPVYAVGAGVSAQTGALWLSAFVIGNVVFQWPIGWLADHADRRAVLAGCALASTVLVGALPLVPATSPAVIAVVLLWGGISFSIYPVALALLGQRMKGGDIARANTAFSMMYILGGLVGRPATGGAMDAFGDPGLGWTLALVYLIAALASFVALRTVRRSVP